MRPMDADELAAVVARAMTHDAAEALCRLDPAVAAGDRSARAAAVFVEILSCRFDEALDAAHLLLADGSSSRIVTAACDLAVAVCAASVAPGPVDAPDDSALGEITVMLEVEAAMSSGSIGAAARLAEGVVGRGVQTPAGAWSALALARARCFEGRFVEADALVEQVLGSPRIAGWPQMSLLGLGVRIFVDAHLDRPDAVRRDLAALREARPGTSRADYVFAGAHALAAFGACAVGMLDEAARLILRAGGGDHLPRLQVVDRLYGYEILVEEALARDDLGAAHVWRERAEGLPIGEHPMAGAALGRIRARLAVATSDVATGMQASADSGALAALAGGELEVIRARVIEAAARTASGDRVRGIEELEDVARRAGATGAAALRRWAERELGVHGRRLRNVPGHGWETLTDTQRSVARLAAAGLRNREIAATLWIAEKTVEHHVAVVLEALGTTNRVGIGRELGGAAVAPSFGAGLTTRQREVAVLVARGCSNRQISTLLGVSEKTVEKHVAALFERLGVRTRAAIGACVRGSEPV